MSISMNGISGTDYSAVINKTQTSDLENTLGSVNKGQATDDEMMKACKDFEQYMIEQVYKSMEKTVIKADEEEENQYTEYFGDMQVQEYAKSVMNQGGFGLAQQMYEAMVRNQGPTSIAQIETE